MPKFVPRQRKHKVLARQKQGNGGTQDANAEVILPRERQEREGKKKALKEEIIQEAQGKMSGKKRKRLDKYIDTKLKKEENLALLKKLASQKVDTSLFQSSKKLGTGQGITLRKRSPSPSSDTDTERREFTSADEALKHPPTTAGPIGGGLKRPLKLDDSGKPVIPMRKRQKKNVPPVVEPEIEWEGFSSDEDNEDGTNGSETDDTEEEDTGDDTSASSSDDEESETDNSDESSEGDSESDTSVDQDSKTVRKERASAFKAWATQQRNEAIGYAPSTNLEYAMPQKPENFEPRALEHDPLPPELETKTATDATRKAFSVAVERSSEIQETRLQLPIVAEEQKIMEAIHNHDVIVVWGATGSGKTTQVPQFLYESGYGAPDGPTPGMIGVTQPRRVAAVSMSKRVGDELGDAGSKVAHQIRFDTTVKQNTAIKFMTDGVLLREISQDFVLTKYSAIVIDEAHERSVNTDILIGMLSRIVDLRAEMAQADAKSKPLKLIIMSATLRISDFTENKRLFRNDPPPLMKAEGRQYTVTDHFARRTNRDYVEEAFRKVCRGHKKLPRGGILVFLTGQNEIMQLAKRLKQTFASTQGQDIKTGKVQMSAAETPLETEDIELGAKPDDYADDDGSDSEGSVIMGLDDDDDEEFDIGEEAAEDAEMKVHILPLYSQLPTNQQLRVFDPPPEGSRLIVLATNVAETSLTIPGIRYVFDCGRAKEKKYDPITGVQSFEVGWISKASANQRAGRAGRTGPGHCYRLYSSAVYERDFEEYAPPEILRTPLESVVLQLKSMGAPVASFPFPTPPDRFSLQKAENLLSYLGAVSAGSKVTKLGHELSLYPLNPRFARMLVTGIAQNLAAETIALVAALSVPELFIPENKLGLRDPPPSSDPDAIRTETENLEAEERSRLRKAYNKASAKLSANAKNADAIKLHTAICAYAYETNPNEFCDDMFLNSKSMHEASQLRSQLYSIVRAHRPTALPGPYNSQLPKPTERTINLLSQICAAGFIDQIAMRADLAPIPPELPRKPKSAIDVPYVTLFPSHVHAGGRRSNDASEEYVYIHPSSLLSRVPVKSLPGFVIYSHLQKAAPSTVMGSKTPKTRMHPLTPVTRAQVLNLAIGTPLVQVSKPKGKVVEMGKDKRECEVEISLVGEKGNQGWGLGVRKVVQRKESTGAWVVEKVVG